MDLQKEQSTILKPMGLDLEAIAQVKKVLEDHHKAIIDRDVDRIMSFYSPDVIAYDLTPPLQYVGAKAYRKSWEEAFAMADPITTDSGYDLHNLNVAASADVAFGYGLLHCYGPMKDGTNMDMWMRSTHCLKKINGKWMIAHEQYSFPIDFDTQKAMINLKPEKNLH